MCWIYLYIYNDCVKQSDILTKLNHSVPFYTTIKSISLTLFHSFVQWNVSWNCFEHSHEHITTNPNNQPTLLTSTQKLKSYNYWRVCSGRGFLQIMCVPSVFFFREPWKTMAKKHMNSWTLALRRPFAPAWFMTAHHHQHSPVTVDGGWNPTNSPVEGTVVYHIRFTGF